MKRAKIAVKEPDVDTAAKHLVVRTFDENGKLIHEDKIKIKKSSWLLLKSKQKDH
jgi:hypothetical protein